MIISKDMLKRGEKIKILYASAHSLQLANGAQLRGHQPQNVQVKYRVWFDEGEKKRGDGLDVNKEDDACLDERCGVG